MGSEKQLAAEDGADASKENSVNEPEEKEPEDKVNLSCAHGSSLWTSSSLLGCTLYSVTIMVHPFFYDHVILSSFH